MVTKIVEMQCLYGNVFIEKIEKLKELLILTIIVIQRELSGENQSGEREAYEGVL